MKNTLRNILIFLSILTIAEAKKKTLAEIQDVIPVTELNASTINECLLGMHPNLAVEFKQGTQFPLQFLAHLKFLSIGFNPNLNVSIDQTYYLRFNGKKVYMSYDLKEWEKPDLTCASNQITKLNANFTNPTTLEANFTCQDIPDYDDFDFDCFCDN